MLANMSARIGRFSVPVRPVLVLALFAVVVSGAVAQQPAFDVASVKPSQPDGGFLQIGFRGGRFVAKNVTLKTLIRFAYGNAEREHTLLEGEVSGGPPWLDIHRFDIEATTASAPETARGTLSRPVLAMLRTLLEERFAVRTHVEIRPSPVFNLVLARPDGALGRQLRRRTAPCTSLALNGAPKDRCGGTTGPGMFRGTGVTILNVADGLSALVDRVVVNQTGLTGTFDVELRWTPDSNPGATPTGGSSAKPDGTLPSFFTAIQEQLGLTLERATAPVDILVIEHAEHPTPN